MTSIPGNSGEVTQKYHSAQVEGQPTPATAEAAAAQAVTSTPSIPGEDVVVAAGPSDKGYFQTPTVDNPQAPIPTAKAERQMMVAEEIKKNASMQAYTSGVGDGTPPPTGNEVPPPPASDEISADGGLLALTQQTVNLWMAYPNVTALLLLALLEYQKEMGKGRLLEAETKVVISEAIFKLGMENADLAKEIRDLEADKEMMKAIQSFVGAGISAIQMGMIIGSRVQVHNEYYGDNPKSDVAKDAKTQQDRLADMKSNKQTVTDKDGFTRVATPDEIAAQEKISAEANSKRDQAFHHDFTYRSDMIRSGGQTLSQTSEGVFALLSSFITKAQGELEKEKGIKDALLQFFSRFFDSTSKSKDDYQAEINRIMQMLAQVIEAYRAHPATRG